MKTPGSLTRAQSDLLLAFAPTQPVYNPNKPSYFGGYYRMDSWVNDSYPESQRTQKSGGFIESVQQHKYSQQNFW